MSWPVAAWLVACVQFAVYRSDTENCASGNIALLHYLVCYVPLLLVIVSLPFIYWKAYKKVSQNIKRTGYFTDVERKMQKSVRKKFCLIVFVFVFCWMPNFVDGFHDLAEYIISETSLENDIDHFVLWMIEASINPLQGILNCLVYGQHRQFASCCSHILSQGHSGSTSLPNNDRNRRFTVNSHSESVRIPVSEISPLLSDRRITPVAPTPPLNSPRNEPFAVRLLGEFAK